MQKLYSLIIILVKFIVILPVVVKLFCIIILQLIYTNVNLIILNVLKMAVQLIQNMENFYL